MKITTTFSRYLLLLLCLLAAGVLADDTDLDSFFDEDTDPFEALQGLMMVKIATGTAQTVSEAPSVTTVITAADIRAMGARELDEVLETVPGFHVIRRNFLYNPSYVIRGIHSEYNPQALMLINGIPITSVYTGDRGSIWGGMTVNNIARIEIIRGPGSALFGADAFSGVINIITKDSEDIDGTEIGTQIGNYDSKGAWLLHGAEYGDVELAFSFEYRDTDGHDGIIEEDLQTYYDRQFGTSASLAPGPVNLGKQMLDTHLDLKYGDWQLRLGYRGRYDVETGAGGAQALDPSGRFKDHKFNADLTYKTTDWLEDWEFTSQASFYDTRYEPTQNIWLFPPGAMGGSYPDGFIGNPGTSERHTRLSFSGVYSGIDKHTISVGIGYNYMDLYEVIHYANYGINPATGEPLPPGSGIVNLAGTPYAFLPEGDRNNWYIFLQDAWQFREDWELTGGVRYDKYSDFGATINPRLALVWQTTEKLTTKLLYGQAFRAPSFQELYNINNPVALGNPNVEAETIETYELAADYQVSEKWRIAANLFYYEWIDVIRFMPNAAGTVFIAQNAGSQTGQGLEIETQWQPHKRFSLNANYALQDATDDTVDADPGNSPRHQLYARADWEFIPTWFINGQFNWVMGRKRIAGDPRLEIDDYTMVDLTLRHKLWQDKLDMTLAVRNVFDTDAYEPSPGPDTDGIIGIPHDLPLADRHYFLGLRYRF